MLVFMKATRFCESNIIIVHIPMEMRRLLCRPTVAGGLRSTDFLWIFTNDSWCRIGGNILVQRERRKKEEA